MGRRRDFCREGESVSSQKVCLHHMFSNEDLDPSSRVCLYCGAACEADWVSEFHGEEHYKAFECEHCGSRNHVCVCFHGSGHDDFGK